MAQDSLDRPHTGWRRRGYLPHYDAPWEVQHIVFRLADSLPVGILARLETAPLADRWAAAEEILDRGAGSRALADPRLARMVMDSLLYFDGRRYDLIAWCVMPTRVHVLIQQRQGWPLAGVVQGWKTFTARSANRILGRQGRFWSPDYFDRATRSEEQTERASVYIENNPVAAGLCANPADWPWSSAAFRSADVLVRPSCGGEENRRADGDVRAPGAVGLTRAALSSDLCVSTIVSSTS